MKTAMKNTNLVRMSITTVVVLLAALLAWLAWHHYMLSPWTRDARIRAEVVRIAPDVAGRVSEVLVQDNQRVEQDQLLYVIDQEPYELAVASARADLAAANAAARNAGASVAAASAGIAASAAEQQMRQQQAARRAGLGDLVSREARDDAAAQARAATAGVAQAQANRQAATAGQQQALASVEQAAVNLAKAELALQRTQVRASRAGTVTNLDVRPGDWASAGQARLALVGSESMWVYAYFEETKLPAIAVGDAVEIRLMAGGVRLRGQVEGIATGIADAASPTSDNLLADVQPTFNWIRLAQRIPVRVRIDPDSVPKGTLLAAGMSASVRVLPKRD
jgi:multidrug resistance efflux pump